MIIRNLKVDSIHNAHRILFIRTDIKFALAVFTGLSALSITTINKIATLVEESLPD